MTRTHFSFRIDTWDDAGDKPLEHIARIEHLQLLAQRIARPSGIYGSSMIAACGQAERKL
jgi:hypothetical protein